MKEAYIGICWEKNIGYQNSLFNYETIFKQYNIKHISSILVGRFNKNKWS